MDKKQTIKLNESQLRNIIKESIKKILRERFQKPENWKDTPFKGTYQDEYGSIYMPDDDYIPDEDDLAYADEVETIREAMQDHISGMPKFKNKEEYLEWLRTEKAKALRYLNHDDVDDGISQTPYGQWRDIMINRADNKATYNDGSRRYNPISSAGKNFQLKQLDRIVKESIKKTLNESKYTDARETNPVKNVNFNKS